MVFYIRVIAEKKYPPLLHLPFDALELLREREKNVFISHQTAVALFENNSLNINMALGLKAFLKRHFDAMSFSQVNNHKNKSARPKSLQLIRSLFIYLFIY